MKKNIRKTITVIFAVIVVLLLYFIISNIIIMNKEKCRFLTGNDTVSDDMQCILILGAGVLDGGVPSHMLKDRLDEGIRLYYEGIAPKILVSGDHGREDYDEVNVMKKYLTDAGIPGEDIFMDHAGFSTYESMIRAKKVFGVECAVIVTQKYHMYRALYICEKTGIDAYGACSDPRTYRGDFIRNFREWIARDKDIFSCLFKITPKYLGEPIDISGNGNVTND